MARKKLSNSWMTPEERSRFDETTRMLEERIAYHHAKAIEEDPSWARFRPWAELDEDQRSAQLAEMVADRIAYHDAKALEEEQAQSA